MSLKSWSRRYASSFSYVGLTVAMLFFAASLSPSLLPRIYVVQGLLSGIAVATGYGVGVLAVAVWQFLELPEPRANMQYIAKRLTAAAVGVVACVFLWRATVWQNSIRELMEMEPLQTAYPWRVAFIATVFGAVLVAGARILGVCFRWVRAKLIRVLPRRVAAALSVVVVATLLLLVVNGVFARALLIAADAAFLQIDKVVDEGIAQPADSMASGSAESLVEWESIGRQGKEFIVGGPSREQLQEFAGAPALRPLRVYVGLRSRATLRQRARLALDELQRVGGFDRSVLVVATPTGTGWLDPGAVDTLEYMHGGDTAIVSMQYSYLPSWITIMVDPNRSRAAAAALFDQIYEHWKQLPTDERPRLYLQGLSLGALGSETCADLFTLFEDPIQGALWSGPPFPSTKWGKAVQGRNPGSPAWLPKIGDGAMVRFTGRQSKIDEGGQRWGPMRFVYIQHASDPMTFFSPTLLYRRPDWLVGQRGPDVSPYLSWYPIVTFLQVACDLPMATTVPTGYGHNMAPASYIDGWVAITDPPAWTAEDTERLQEEFQNQQVD